MLSKSLINLNKHNLVIASLHYYSTNPIAGWFINCDKTVRGWFIAILLNYKKFPLGFCGFQYTVCVKSVSNVPWTILLQFDWNYYLGICLCYQRRKKNPLLEKTCHSVYSSEQLTSVFGHIKFVAKSKPDQQKQP